MISININRIKKNMNQNNVFVCFFPTTAPETRCGHSMKFSKDGCTEFSEDGADKGVFTHTSDSARTQPFTLQPSQPRPQHLTGGHELGKSRSSRPTTWRP